ncbi:MAG: prolipoprotein diacylglyceryl transferase [Candidatus Kaelpia aquatica]|nr:prolipoprotein diacylglyceryl transferase [Candidatus Kaelpia aquatica]
MHPVIIQFGSLAIRSYGVMLVIAFLAAFYLAKYDSKRIGLNKKNMDSIANYLLLGGLLGARVYYGLFYDPYYYFTKPWALLFIWQGGLAVHGAIIGGILSLYIFSKRNSAEFLKLADFLIPLLLLGQAIGRIGCFLNGCCYGLPTEKPWGIIFTKDSSAYYQYGFQALHPTQLYEFILSLIGFVFLWVIRKDSPFRGFIFSLYLIYYGLIRFYISLFRADSLYLWGSNIKIAYLVSLGLVLFGVVVLTRGILKAKKN